MGRASESLEVGESKGLKSLVSVVRYPDRGMRKGRRMGRDRGVGLSSWRNGRLRLPAKLDGERGSERWEGRGWGGGRGMVPALTGRGMCISVREDGRGEGRGVDSILRWGGRANSGKAEGEGRGLKRGEVLIEARHFSLVRWRGKGGFGRLRFSSENEETAHGCDGHHSRFADAVQN